MSEKTGKKEEKKRKSKGSRAVTVFLVILLLIGIGIMLYPTFADWYNNLHQSRAIADYNRTVDTKNSEENEKLWEEALAYNADLAKTGNDFNFSDLAEDDPRRVRYNETLDISGTGIMGYIEIDSVNIRLPIYHDTTEGVLQVAVGHLAGTSLPVGGESTHAVLTGHTGLPSARLFTDIDQLKIGDEFMIIVLDHILTYEVEDIRVVLPEEVSSLAIQEGRDLVTLVTCTPYGINTHRLLVTGHRIPTKEPAPIPSADWRADVIVVNFLLAVPFLIAAAAVIAVVFIVRHRRRKKKAA